MLAEFGKLEMQDREALKYSKWSLMGDSGWSSGGRNVDRNVDNKGQVHEDSVRNKNYIDSCIRSQVCYTVAENLHFAHASASVEDRLRTMEKLTGEQNSKSTQHSG